MEVMAGYKATDVGVIPIDWDVGTVADVVTSFQNGFAFASHGYVKSGMPIVTMAQIGLDGVFNFQSEAVNYWPLKAASALAAFQLVGGDIIVAMTDVTPQKNLIGRMVQVTEEGPLLLNQRVGLLRISAEKVDPYFLRAISNSSGWRTYARAVASLGVQANISTTDILSGKLPLPSLQEQRAIAAALSDVDALIAGLEKMIAKKRDLKQAAMQQLLTGQTRLPGFSGEWVEACLGDLARIQRGASPRPIESPVWFDDTSSVGWVRISDVTSAGMYLTETQQRLSPLGIQHSRPVERGNLIMSICATVGRPVITEIDVCIHDGFVVFDKPQADKHFLYYVLKWIEPNWSKQGQTGSQMNLNTPLINGTKIMLPPTDEQKAIASALSEMDADLTAQESRLAKTRDLKQGMMQELLTGRIRLV
jgi:type I restriction enzyme S subunit